MKKILVTLAALYLCSGVNAQLQEPIDLDYFPYYFNMTPSKELSEQYKTNHVKTVVEYAGNRNQRIIKETNFDNNGEAEMVTNYRRNGTKTVYSGLTSGGKPNIVVYNAKGEILRQHNYIYNSDTLIVREEHMKKGKVYFVVTNDYQGKKLLKSTYFDNGSNTPKRTWVYEYYADGSRKTSKLYKEGKLKSVWNYECKEAGELVRPHQDTVMICKNESIDAAGNRTVTVRKYDEKGRPTRTVNVYNSDNKLIEISDYNSKDRLSYHFYRNYEKHESGYMIYSRSGKRLMGSDTRYDEKERPLEMIAYRGKRVTHIEKNEYSASGKLIYTLNSWSEGKRRTETRYTYDNLDLLTTSIKTTSGGKVSNMRKVVYNFY